MKNIKYLMIQDTIKKALLMAFFIILARTLSVEDFGLYQQVILISSFMTVIFSVGIPTSITYFYGQYAKFSERNSVFKRFFYFQIILLAVGTSLLILFAERLSELLENSLLNQVAVVVIVVFVTNSLFEFFKNVSVAKDRVKVYTLGTTFVQMLALIVNIANIFLFRNVIYVLYVIAFFNVVTFIWLMKVNSKYLKLTVKTKLVSKVEFKYIVAMGSVSLIGVFNGYIDQLMVSIMLSVNDYANLKIGSFQIPFVSIITGSLLTAMIPILSRMSKENNTQSIIETWTNSIEKAILLLVPIVIFCLVFAEEIILSLFSDKYYNSIIIFQVYMFQWLRAVVIFGGVMGAIGLERTLFKNTILVTCLNIVLNYFMILNFGVIGAALTTTFLNYFGAFLLIRPINRRLKSSFYSYFPLKKYFISIVLSLFVAIAFKFSTTFVDFNILYLVIVSVTFYFVMLSLQVRVFYKKMSIAAFKRLI